MSEKRNKSDLLPLWRSISGGKKTPNTFFDCQPQSWEMILVEDGECWLFNHLAQRDKRERDRGAKQKPNTSSLSFSVANCGLELKVRYLTLVVVASSWFQFSVQSVVRNRNQTPSLSYSVAKRYLTATSNWLDDEIPAWWWHPNLQFSI